MQIEYTGRQTEIGPELRATFERRLAKLQRVLPAASHVHAVLTLDKHRLTAEVTVSSPHLGLVAAESGHDAGALFVTVLERLTRQAQRHVGKWRGRKRDVPSRERALWKGVLGPAAATDGDGAEPSEPRIVHSRRFLPKPLSVEEACFELDAGDDGVVVFREARSGRINVLYRRKNGDLGLIEPEA